MRLLIFLLGVSSLFSFYVGNPASPGIMDHGLFSARYPFFKATTGYLADYTSNKRYTASQTDPAFDPNQIFREFGLHSQMATASVIGLGRVELFGMAGGTKEHVKWYNQPSETDLSAIFFNFRSSYSFSWCVGLKAILLQWGNTSFGADFSYFAVPASPKSFFRFFNRLNLPIEMVPQKFSVKEWQANVGLAAQFAILTPYVGVTYLHSRMTISQGPETPTTSYSNDRTIGYFYGLTLSVTGRLHLDFERRLTDEFGYSFVTTAVF